MKVVRILIFDGSPDWLDEQLGRSIPDGVKVITGGNKIKIVTLGELPDIADLIFSKKSDFIQEEKEGEDNG